MKLFFLAAFCFFNATEAFSQSISKWQAKLDTGYITILPSKWSVRIYSASKYDQFTFSGAGFTSSFKPDVKVSVGIGVSYKHLGLDVGWGFYSSDPSHKSKSFSLLSSLYFRAHMLEITAQEYQYYSARVFNASNEPSADQFRTDMHTLNLGLNYNYNFNNRKYSFKAAFKGRQIQKRSAGSPLAGAYLSYFNLNADSAIISSAYANTEARITQATLFTVGVAAGYAYTLVLPAHFYIMLSLTPKLALNGGNTKTTIDHSVPINITPGFLTRNAIGYSSMKWYSLISVLVDYNSINTGSGNRLSYDPVKVKMLVGYRFN